MPDHYRLLDSATLYGESIDRGLETISVVTFVITIPFTLNCKCCSRNSFFFSNSLKGKHFIFSMVAIKVMKFSLKRVHKVHVHDIVLL